MSYRSAAMITRPKLMRTPVVAVAAMLACQLLPAAPVTSAGSEYRVFLDRYCVTCHNDRLYTAGLTLSSADPTNVAGSAALWEKIVGKLQTGAMPPAGAPRPDRASYDSVTKFVQAELDRAAQAKPQAGHV